MPRVIEGKLDATGLKFGIVVSRFNEFNTGKLLAGELDAIVRNCASDEDVDVVWMPGSFELPLAAKSWPRPASMTPSSASARSSAAGRATSISWPAKPQRASRRPPCRPVFP